MKKKISQIVKYLFFLLLGFFLLWFSFRNLDLRALWNDIQTANYSWAAVAIACAVISHFFRALRWNLLIKALGYKTRATTTFYAVMIGYMANLAVPRLGEFMRCGVLTKKEKIPFNALLGSVISERLCDLVILIGLLVVVVVFQWQLLGGLVTSWLSPFIEMVSENILTLGIFIGSVIILGLLIYFLVKKFKNLLMKSALYIKITDLLEGLLDGIKTIKTMKDKYLFAFYTLMVWVFYVLMTWLPFFMLPEMEDLNLAAGITFLAIGSLGIVAPVPGGIGAYHFIGKTLLTGFYNISPLVAGSFVAITHAAQTLMNIVVGGLSYLIMFFIDHKAPLNGTTTDIKK